MSGGAGYKLQSDVRVLNEDAKVSKVIDFEVSCRKSDLVIACLDPMEASHVLSIPLSFQRSTDVLCWPGERMVSIL